MLKFRCQFQAVQFVPTTLVREKWTVVQGWDCAEPSNYLGHSVTLEDELVWMWGEKWADVQLCFP